MPVEDPSAASNAEVDGVGERTTRLRATVGQRLTLRRLLFLVWTLLWVVGTVAVLEAVSRWWLVPWHQEVGSRHMQPYFMSGGYFQTPLPGVPTHTLLLGPGGPGTYGYRREAGTYVFGFEQPVTSVADRGTFLFQDRVDLANAPPRPGVWRVFVLGGSSAYGAGASDRSRRWYLHLERSLTASLGQVVQVIPAAMVGHVSTQERLALELMVLPRHPDAIVILDGWNDAALPATFGVRPGDPYDQGMLYGDFYLALGGVRKWLARHSALARYLVHRRLAKAIEAQRAALVASPDRVAAYADSTSAVYVDNLSRMLDRCEDEGVPCLAFLQPSRDFAAGAANPTARNPLVVASYDRIRRRLQDLRPGAPVHDLSALLPVDAFVDTVHFGDAGQEAVAQAVHPRLEALLRDARQGR
jgi:lysophospholipase L1-like esterase